MEQAPEFVAVGHVTIDLTPTGARTGGTATYAARVASQLGLRAAIVTSAAADFDLIQALPGVESCLQPSEKTTVFEHQYRGLTRIQYVRQLAGAIDAAAIPTRFRPTGLLLLGPVLGEVGPELLQSFPNALVCLSVQGCLRRVAGDGRLEEGYLGGLSLDAFQGRLSILALSRDDLAGQPLPQAWLETVPLVVLTNAEREIWLHSAHRWWRMDTFATIARDSTGAGDAFAAALLICYGQTGDIAEATRFAAATASFVVEASGIAGAPSRAAVLQRMSERPEIRLSPADIAGP